MLCSEVNCHETDKNTVSYSACCVKSYPETIEDIFELEVTEAAWWLLLAILFVAMVVSVGYALWVGLKVCVGKIVRDIALMLTDRRLLSDVNRRRSGGVDSRNNSRLPSYADATESRTTSLTEPARSLPSDSDDAVEFNGINQNIRLEIDPIGDARSVDSTLGASEPGSIVGGGHIGHSLLQQYEWMRQDRAREQLTLQLYVDDLV